MNCQTEGKKTALKIQKQILKLERAVTHLPIDTVSMAGLKAKHSAEWSLSAASAAIDAYIAGQREAV